MTFPIYQLVFFSFATVLVLAAILTITVRNPVYAVLFLVLAFVASSGLWMLLQAEFLSLVLIFVYVGAVMTLFLFVVMMLNIDLSVLKKKFVRFLPIGVLAMAMLVGMLFLAFKPQHYLAGDTLPTFYPPDYSDVKSLGMLLYTSYLFPFEIAAVILFVAIIAAISLAFHGRKSDAKAQKVEQQLKANKKNRLRIVSDMRENEQG